jgi:hypothetical protein
MWVNLYRVEGGRQGGQMSTCTFWPIPFVDLPSRAGRGLVGELVSDGRVDAPSVVFHAPSRRDRP